MRHPAPGLGDVSHHGGADSRVLNVAKLKCAVMKNIRLSAP